MNKVKAKNRQNNLESDSDESNQQAPNLDLSLMRQPIATSITGFEEVLRAYEAGTNELRKLLSRECDLIYECKVCRNIFRSLTNFISHKRVYCRSSFNASDHFHFRDDSFQVQDISTIIQAEQEINNNPNGAAGNLPGADDKSSGSKDLSGIVERLLWKQHQSRTSNLNDFYEQIQSGKKIQHDDPSHKSHMLKLNRVNDSDIAVYQSLQVDNENSNMKDEIHEVHKMLQKANTVLGPDGKVLNLFNSMEKNGSPAPSTEESEFTCQICNLPFETEKTLKLHLEMKHLPSTYVYQCPSCPQKFSSSAAVIKHLSNDHKKNNRRIRLMRDNIIKKRMRADEVVLKVPSVNRELQKLQQSNNTEPTQEENTDWNSLDLNGDYQNDSYICPSCFKKFDRKAVYTSHVQACSDAKCRERVKTKKRKAKEEETKMKQLLEFEDNSNASEQSVQDPPEAPVSLPVPEVDTNKAKRKRKQVNKVKKLETEVKLVVQKEESNSVDWNLDDEEEKKQLENIKREIIEDDYKRERNSVDDSGIANTSEAQQEPDDDDDDSALVIDEKLEEDPSKQFPCPQCDKEFDTDEKLKYHLNTYHSRQKRFKCKKCEYQGYRKKDTVNHLNYVHNINGDKETLESYMESVMKAVDEESLARQNELKKNQLRIKRRIAREKLKLNGSKDGNSSTTEPTTSPKQEPPEIKIEFKEPAAVSTSESAERLKPPKIRRKSLHTSILIPPESDSKEDLMKIPKMFIKTKIETSVIDEKKKSSHRKRSRGGSSTETKAGQSLLNISKFGKIVKRSPNGDLKEGNTQRPIRNRIKPVRKDFLYDLSDLLKKDADAYREQAFQSTNVTYKRELRKRAMSTSTRETPGLNSFDEPSSPTDSQVAQSLLGPPATPKKGDSDIPSLKFKDIRNRRMSVFPTYPAVPRSPIYKPPAEPTVEKPNAGAAYKMALREFNACRASLYEPKFLWSICFEREPKITSLVPSSVPLNAPSTSAAASILQKLSGKMEMSLAGSSSVTKSKSVEEKSTSSLTAEQLCKNFDMINVTSISENELDIPESRAINLNPGQNGLVELALEGAGIDVCVLQECSPESDEDDDDDDDDDDDEKPSSSSTVSDVEPKKARLSKHSEHKVRRSKKGSEKRKSGANGQRRLTVMQRLQENKIRKSREQLFKRLIMDRQNDDENPSPVYNLFSES